MGLALAMGVLHPVLPDREWHGNFNELISLTRPAVVAWDVIFDTSREGGGDAKMGLGTQAAMERGTAVIVGAATTHDPPEVRPGPDGPTRPLTHVEGDVSRIDGDDYALIPFPELRAVCVWGIVDAQRASDGIIREVPLVARVGRRVYPSLGLQTLMSYFRVAAGDVRVRLGDAIYLPTPTGVRRIPIGADGHYLLNYRYDQPDFPTHTYAEILLKTNAWFVEKTPGAPRPPDLAGKIVFVGQTVTGKADAGPTPLNAYAPLVLTHANLVDNVLAGDYVRRAPAAVLWLGALLAGYAAMLLLADRSVILLCGGTVLGVVAYASLAIWAWVLGSLWLPVVAPLGGFGLLQFVVIGRRVLQEQRAKQEIKGMFGTYVSPHLVEQLVRAGERPKLGGHEAELSAYFSDIQGFSSLAEQLPADRLVALMNEYLTACTDILLEEGGSLDKYIGDAVVAMFGAPVPLPDHALRACVAAQRVQARLAESARQMEKRGRAVARGRRGHALAHRPQYRPVRRRQHGQPHPLQLHHDGGRRESRGADGVGREELGRLLHVHRGDAAGLPAARRRPSGVPPPRPHRGQGAHPGRADSRDRGTGRNRDGRRPRVRRAVRAGTRTLTTRATGTAR